MAELCAVHSPAGSDDACLDALERDGLMTKGKGRVPDFAPLRTHKKKLLSDMVIEDRG